MSNGYTPLVERRTEKGWMYLVLRLHLMRLIGPGRIVVDIHLGNDRGHLGLSLRHHDLRREERGGAEMMVVRGGLGEDALARAQAHANWPPPGESSFHYADISEALFLLTGDFVDFYAHDRVIKYIQNDRRRCKGQLRGCDATFAHESGV